MRIFALIITLCAGCTDTEVHSPIQPATPDVQQFTANRVPMPNAGSSVDADLSADTEADSDTSINHDAAVSRDAMSADAQAVQIQDASQTVEGDAEVEDAGSQDQGNAAAPAIDSGV